MSALGRRTENIPGTFTEPELFSLFPTDGRVGHSAMYIARAFLGHGYFTGAYQVEYTFGESTGRMFFMECESSVEATEKYDRFHRFFGRTGSVSTQTNQLTERGFFGTDRSGRAFSLFRRGRFLFGAIGLGSDQHAIRNLVDLDERLAAYARNRPAK